MELYCDHALGLRNTEGERMLKFAVANDLVIGNSSFMKPSKHLVTYRSGEIKTQIDCLLYPRSFQKHVTNVTVIVNEEYLA